jgi:uncharacterized protein (TIGR01777 family)
MSRRIVLLGASGFIGQALLRHLRAADYEVVTVDRHPLPNGLSWSDPWQAQLDGAFGVINLAGAPITLPWTPTNRDLILNSRVDSAAQIAVAVQPPTVWLNASAVGFYGDRGDEELTEASTSGTGYLAEVCRAWENAVQSPVRHCVVRTGIVLGPGGGALAPLAKLARFGLGGALGSGRQWMSWIDLADLCDLYQFLLEQHVHGPVNAVGPEPIRNHDFMHTLRAAVKRPWSPPAPALGLALVGKLGGPDPSILLDSVRAKPAVALRSGFRFANSDLRATLERSLA